MNSDIYVLLMIIFSYKFLRTSLVVQWLTLYASTSGGTGSIPGLGTKIPNAMQAKEKK